MAGRLTLSLGYLLVGCCLMTGVRARSLECRQEGRFPHPEDCGSYVDCMLTANGDLLAREGHCHGYPYSAEKRRCVDHSEISDCVIKGTRISFPAPDFNYACATNSSASGCVNCNLAYTCINGNATIDLCNDKSVCENTHETNARFGGSVCLTLGSPINSGFCSCSKIGLSPDPIDSTYFHYCGSTNDVPETFACEPGLKFNDVSQTCEVSGPPQTPSCEGKTGSFVNPNDCSWFYTCIPGGIVRDDSCDSDKYFNETSGVCVDKCEFGELTEVEECKDIGFLRHPTDCAKYLICNEINQPPEEASCYPGLFFNEDRKRCSDTTPSADCQGGFDYLTCPGHSDIKCP